VKSKLITLGGTDAAPTATIADATITDIFTTAISTTEALTGSYKILQEAALIVVGMVIQNKRVGGGFNPFAS
jgi:hypothetical protein